jgi:hypothetical protein
MASWAEPQGRTPSAHKGPTRELVIQSVGPGLQRVEAPEGWVKKVERAREGKVWVGFFHVWETASDGQRVRRKKEKTLGPATKPKHEALNDLAELVYSLDRDKKGEIAWQVRIASRAGRPSGSPSWLR